ncbi:MAG TPA: acylneuraminate cytidylyltransferase family protein [Pirellulales bacterium]|jgi:CMP-N-acetylneuraminic acid synthetase|nr:acylneuraminate cytidylyltransferase family protein [Pirellulales bacterium]
MRILGIIPARGGSQRVPRKNVRPLGGKPLVAHSIEAALGATKLTRLVVSSDDAEILQIARDYDLRLALPRPAEISTDRSLAIEFVQHALSQLESSGEPAFAGVAIIQPSSPLTQSTDIDATISLLEATGADSAVSVMALDHAIHPIKLKTMEGDRLLPFWEEERGRMAMHELPALYVRNCAVYVTRRNVLDSGSILGSDSRGYVMPRERSVDINDPFDLELAEFLFARMT